MIYHCDRCRAVLPGGVTVCPQCGREFDAPVPGSATRQAAPTADPSVDDFLRNRTASRGTGNGFGNAAPGTDPVPAWYGPLKPARRSRPVWPWVTVGVAATLGLIGWGAGRLWTRGPGGEMSYRQHNLAGNAAAERGDFQTADDEYSAMISLRPQKVDGYLLRAISEEQGGQTAAAIDDNTTALTLTQEPMTRGNLFYNRAEALAKEGRFPSAIADFTQAKSEYTQVTDPRLLGRVPDLIEDVYSLRADAYWHHKDYALSIQDSKAAIAIGHVHPDDYGVQAKAEAALGLDQAAAADFKQSLQMDPEYADAYYGLGNLAEKHHQYVQGVDVYRQATRVSPDSVQFWGNLGWFQYLAGQEPAALASDQHALSLDRNQAWILYNFGLTYAAMGQSVPSKAAYANALAVGTPADQKAGLNDIHNALAKQPGSAALRLALAQVQAGRAGDPRPSRLMLPLPSQAEPPSAPPKPQAAFAALLGPEVVEDGYGIQPPRGYTLTQSRAVTLSSASNVYLWSGPRRADGTVPTLQVVIGKDDGSLAAHTSSPQVTQEALDDMGSNHSHLTTSFVSTVTLSSLTFGRGDWDGVGVQTGKEYKGSEYWSVSPSHIIHLSSHDAVPYAATTLPLIQASILTFRKI